MKYQIRRKNTKGKVLSHNCSKNSAEVHLVALQEKKDETLDKKVHIKYYIARNGEQVLEINSDSNVRIKRNDVT